MDSKLVYKLIYSDAPVDPLVDSLRTGSEIKSIIIIDGENKKEHVYLIPKIKVHRYGDNRVYFNISENSLKEF